ncbi:uncharacterized protein [Taeniopygia guttata]|uniref:uncharacterized protein n=1 Tax=Taeniopygia guttata TaxID=59729 RepID=UPI003BB8BEE7
MREAAMTLYGKWNSAVGRRPLCCTEIPVRMRKAGVLQREPRMRTAWGGEPCHLFFGGLGFLEIWCFGSLGGFGDLGIWGLGFWGFGVRVPGIPALLNLSRIRSSSGTASKRSRDPPGSRWEFRTPPAQTAPSSSRKYPKKFPKFPGNRGESGAGPEAADPRRKSGNSDRKFRNSGGKFRNSRKKFGNSSWKFRNSNGKFGTPGWKCRNGIRKSGNSVRKSGNSGNPGAFPTFRGSVLREPELPGPPGAETAPGAAGARRDPGKNPEFREFRQEIPESRREIRGFRQEIREFRQEIWDFCQEGQLQRQREQREFPEFQAGEFQD